MTTSAKKKETQTPREKKKERGTDQGDEYHFFVTGDGSGIEDALKKDIKNEQSLENGIIKAKKSINFFLPE